VSRRAVPYWRSLRFKGWLAFGVPFLVLTLSVIMLVKAIERSQSAADEAIVALHTHRATQAVTADLATANQGLVTVLLTGDPVGAQTWTDARGQVSQDLATLDAASGLDQRRVAQVQDVANRLLASLDGVAAGAAAGTPVDELAPQYAQAVQLNSEFEGALDAVADQAQRRVEQTANSARDASDRAMMLLVAVMLVAIGGGAIIANRLWISVVRRTRRLDLAADAIAERRPLPDMPDGRDEIGELGATLERVAEVITDREEKLFLALGAGGGNLFEFDPTTGRMRIATFPLDGRNQVIHTDGFASSLLADIHPDDQEKVRQGFAAAFSDHQPLVVEYRSRAADGQERWYESRGSVVGGTAGDGGRLVGITVDVTEHKKSEHSLAAARQEAEQASREKSGFLSRLSHELRTPLNTVLGFAELLAQEQLSEMQREEIALISRAGHDLLRLVNDLLDLSRLDAGRVALELELVPLGEVVEEAVGLTRFIAEPRRITIKGAPDPDVFIFADRRRVFEILLNLVSNAVKYSSEGTTVTVTCEKNVDGRARSRVIDEGVGIPADKMEAIFEPFQRLTTAVGGTGLGLALAQGFATSMGGEISVTSRVGKGSTFTLDLPLAPADRMNVAPKAPPAALPDGKVRVLAIEDDPPTRRLLVRSLAYHDRFELTTAMDGAQGLVRARADLPQMILLDVNLPDMNGADVLERLRSDHATRSIPVIVVTADGTSDTRERMLARGAEAVVTKPFRIGDLYEHIGEVLLAKATARVG